MSAQEEEILAWQEQLAIYRRNLKHLLQQAAQFGGEASVPLHIANDLLETRTNIQRLKSQLHTANIAVQDVPDDKQPATPAWKQPLLSSRYKLYAIVALLGSCIFAIAMIILVNSNSFKALPQGTDSSSITSAASALPTTMLPISATSLPTSAISAVPAPEITAVAMTKPNFIATDGRSIRLIVIRTTTGGPPTDYEVLRKGGITISKDGVATELVVSNHYYIDKNGSITQFVQDKDIAFHAKTCNWVIDGEQIADKKVTINNQEVTICNALSIAVTLSNQNNGEDPYTALQYDALLAVTRFLVTKYSIPQSQLVRSSDISSKEPLNGFPQWSRFVAQVYNK